MAVWVRSSEMQNIAMLAQATLSESGEVQWVERQALQKIIDEQALTDSGLIDADHAIAVGALVSCDLFASVEGGKSDASLVVFDAHSGIRLCDVPIGTRGGDESAGNDLTAHLRGAVAKARQIAAGHVLCIHTVRNADLPHTFDPLCSATAKMLERRLCASPDVSILERSRLDKITEEHQLTGAEAALTASANLLDLQVARSSGTDAAQHGAIDITVVVKGLGGKTLATASASVNDLNAQAMAEAIFPKLIQSLKLAAPPPPSDADRRLEAGQFARETLIHWQHSEISEAVESAEAAYALNPEDRHLLGMRARALAAQSAALACNLGDFANPARPTDVTYNPFVDHHAQFVLSFQYASAALDAISIAQVHVGQKWPLNSDPIFFATPVLDDEFMIRNALQILRRYLGQIRWEQSERKEKGTGVKPLVLRPDERKAYEAALLAFRHYRLEMEEPVARELVTDERTYQAYYVYLTGLMHDLRCVCALDGKQWTTDWKSIVDTWIPLAVQYSRSGPREPGPWEPPPLLDADKSVLLLSPLYDAPDQNLGVAGMERPQSEWDTSHYSRSWRMSADDWKRYRSIYELIGAGIPDPRVQVSARRVEHYLDLTLAAANAPPTAPPAALVAINPQQLHGADGAPQPMVGPGTEWPDSMVLLDANEPGQAVDEIGFPVVGEPGKSAYAIATLRGSSPRRSPALLKFDLATGRFQSVAAFDPNIDPMGTGDDSKGFIISQARFRGSRGSICGDWFVLCDPTTAVFLFPLSGGAVSLVNQRTAHLPASNYQATAVLNDILYLGVGRPERDGYLLAYDLKTSSLKTLAASRRVAAGAQAASPFDDSAPLFIWFMQADPVRHRIVFLVGNSAWEKGKSGWWSYEPGAGQFKQIYACEINGTGHEQRESTWATVHGDKIIFSSLRVPPAVLDLASDKVAPMPPVPLCQNFGLTGGLPESGPVFISPLEQADGWTWGAFGRYRPSTIKADVPRGAAANLVQCFDPPVRGDYRCGEWPAFITVIDGDRVLAGDNKTLWSIHVPVNDPAAMARVLRTPKPVPMTVQRIGPPPSGGELSWSSVRTVYDVAGYEDGVMNLRGPIIRGDYVYVLACGVHPRAFDSAQLRRYGLFDGSRTDYGESSFRALGNRAPEDLGGQVNMRVNLETAMNKDHYYVADPDQRRISLFSFDDHPPSQFTLKLPPKIGVAWRGFAPTETGDVLVALETVALAPGTDRWNRPAPRAKLYQLDGASGKTTEVRLPAPKQLIDEKEAIHIGPVAYDDARKRVVFFMCRDTPDLDFDGIYALDGTGIKRIIPVDVTDDLKFGNDPFRPGNMFFRWCSRVRDDRWNFGFASGGFEANFTTLRVSSLCPPIPPMKVRYLPYPMVSLGGWLYHGGFGRVSVDGTQYEQFPLLRPIADSAYRFSACLLEPTADDKSLVVADNCGMWILKLKD